MLTSGAWQPPVTSTQVPFHVKVIDAAILDRGCDPSVCENVRMRLKVRGHGFWTNKVSQWYVTVALMQTALQLMETKEEHRETNIILRDKGKWYVTKRVFSLVTMFVSSFTHFDRHIEAIKVLKPFRSSWTGYWHCKTLYIRKQMKKFVLILYWHIILKHCYGVYPFLYFWFGSPLVSIIWFTLTSIK